MAKTVDELAQELEAHRAKTEADKQKRKEAERAAKEKEQALLESIAEAKRKDQLKTVSESKSFKEFEAIVRANSITGDDVLLLLGLSVTAPKRTRKKSAPTGPKDYYVNPDNKAERMAVSAKRRSKWFIAYLENGGKIEDLEVITA